LVPGRRPRIGEGVYAKLLGFGNMSIEHWREHLGSGGKFA
jgi:hypothetical protein